MFSATAAMRPEAIATSRTAAILFLGVDDLTALEEEIVLGLGQGGGAEEEKRCKTHGEMI
jgi:hypothetical protein